MGVLLPFFRPAVDGQPPRAAARQRIDHFGQDVAGNPVSVLEFDRDVLLGQVGARFALQRGDIYEGDPRLASVLSHSGD